MVTSSACAAPAQQPSKTTTATKDGRSIGELLEKWLLADETDIRHSPFWLGTMHFRTGTAPFGTGRMQMGRVLNYIMPDGNSPSPAEGGSRVINFRRNRAGAGPTSSAPVKDLTKFERGESPDDYRHRMIVNIVVFVFVAGLIGAGIWLADTMAAMRKNQDCVLSGRRGCTPVEVSNDRW